MKISLLVVIFYLFNFMLPQARAQDSEALPPKKEVDLTPTYPLHPDDEKKIKVMGNQKRIDKAAEKGEFGIDSRRNFQNRLDSINEQEREATMDGTISDEEAADINKAREKLKQDIQKRIKLGKDYKRREEKKAKENPFVGN